MLEIKSQAPFRATISPRFPIVLEASLTRLGPTEGDAQTLTTATGDVHSKCFLERFLSKEPLSLGHLTRKSADRLLVKGPFLQSTEISPSSRQILRQQTEALSQHQGVAHINIRCRKRLPHEVGAILKPFFDCA